MEQRPLEPLGHNARRLTQPDFYRVVEWLKDNRGETLSQQTFTRLAEVVTQRTGILLTAGGVQRALASADLLKDFKPPKPPKPASAKPPRGMKVNGVGEGAPLAKHVEYLYRVLKLPVPADLAARARE